MEHKKKNVLKNSQIITIPFLLGQLILSAILVLLSFLYLFFNHSLTGSLLIIGIHSLIIGVFVILFNYGHLINKILFTSFNFLILVSCFYIVCFSEYGIKLVPNLEYEKYVFKVLLYFTYFNIAFIFSNQIQKKASLKKRQLRFIHSIYFLFFFIGFTSNTNFTKGTFLSLSGQGDLKANIKAKIWIWKYETELDKIIKEHNIKVLHYSEMYKSETNPNNIPPILVNFIKKTELKYLDIRNGRVYCSLKSKNKNNINFSKGNSSIPKTPWYKTIIEQKSNWEYNLGNGWKISYYDGRGG